MRIGFFDSGMGGLTILKAVRKRLPQYDYVYFGDTAHVPYGNKDESEIHALTLHGITKLFDAGAVLAIVACNSASAESLRIIQDTFLKEKYPERRVLGVIIPTVETLVESGGHSALLIGTTRTVQSHKYERELTKVSSIITLYTHATPTLVPKIEIGDIDGALTDACFVIDTYVGKIDTVILGCTHYTLLKEQLRLRYSDIHFLSQDEIIPEKLSFYLHRHEEIQKRVSVGGTIEIILSAETPEYDEIKKDFLIV